MLVYQRVHPSLLGFLKDGPGKSEDFKNVASLETIRDLPNTWVDPSARGRFNGTLWDCLKPKI